MATSDPEKRMAELREIIARHDELYYRQAEPEITDREYDELKRELADLEADNPLLAMMDSPTQKVGDDRSEGFQSYQHRERMMSLDNTYSGDEMREFIARLERELERTDLTFFVEPKIDGLAVSVTSSAANSCARSLAAMASRATTLRPMPKPSGTCRSN